MKRSKKLLRNVKNTQYNRFCVIANTLVQIITKKHGLANEEMMVKQIESLDSSIKLLRYGTGRVPLQRLRGYVT